MNRLTINHLFLTAILSATIVALSAIILNYAGAVDMNVGEWLKIRIESGQ